MLVNNQVECSVLSVSSDSTGTVVSSTTIHRYWYGRAHLLDTKNEAYWSSANIVPGSSCTCTRGVLLVDLVAVENDMVPGSTITIYAITLQVYISTGHFL